MAVERLSLAAVPVVLVEGEDVNKAPRLPRWTRQELLVLIQGKRVAENRVRRGRSAVLAFGSGQVEPKWSSVSSYCKRHGVNRGPVQCRKRWSNLAGDFKKIKEWESQEAAESESFWAMRNDLRRERKLPGFFDREVYDILDDDGPSSVVVVEQEGEGDRSLLLSLAPSLEAAAAAAQTHKEKEKEKEVVFDSGRRIDDGLFSDSPDKEPPTAPTPISATQYDEPFSHHHATTTQDKQETSPITSPTTHQKSTRKRKRPAPDDDDDDDDDADAEDVSVQNQLIEAMERNGRLLSSQLEIQNTNAHLDREQRKDHATTLFSVLNKLADAMVRIADKL